MQGKTIKKLEAIMIKNKQLPLNKVSFPAGEGIL